MPIRQLARLSLALGLLMLLTSGTYNIGEADSIQCSPPEMSNLVTVPSIFNDPIVITENANFTDLGFPGSGTAEDPYMISDLAFSTSGTAITIRETDCHFIIKDCEFVREGPDDDAFGISFDLVRNGRVEGCTFLSLDIGIIIEASLDCNITRCETTGTLDPIILETSSYCWVSHNRIEGGGIVVFASDHCYVNSNILQSGPEGGRDGIGLSESELCILFNNTISNFIWGIALWESPDNSIIGNMLFENGLFLDSLQENDYNATVADCFVNDKKLGYFRNEDGLQLDGDDFGQLILFDCNNITIQGGEFNHAGVGILVAYGSHCNFSEVTSHENHYGVLIVNSDNCTLVNGVVTRNWEGIHLLRSCTGVQVLNSLVSQNTGNGILIINGYECRIIGNEIRNNGGIGLQVKSAWGHEIYYNTFGGNIDYNAFDWGTGSSWDDGISCGNYWDDLIPGAVYVIPGEGAIDHFQWH
jgi:parallel beta-helix repeat protein